MAAPTTEEERELLVQGLMSLQTGCDERYARFILKKHGWNADQAATALLDVATVEEEKKNSTSIGRRSEAWIGTGALNSSTDTMPIQQRANSVIDLTSDDDDATAKALRASIEALPVFGPSNRVDDAQQWAVVSSNAPPTLSQEDQALSQALEASLSSSFVGASQEPYEEPTDPIERVRKEGWPTALRTTHSSLCYAPIVLQCLTSLPNVKARLLRYSVSCDGSEDQHVFTQRLQRLAAMLTHTCRAYVVIDDFLENLVPLPISNQDTLPSATLQYFSTLAFQLEQIPHSQDDPLADTPLLTFEGIETDAGANESSNYRSSTYMEVVAPSASGNDLASCLADILTKSEVCVTQLSECIVFLLRRQDIAISAGAERMPFKYPGRLYLDRFMRDNLERTNELRNCQEGIQHEAQKLATDRFKLSNWKNADTLSDLRSSLRYFETVATDGGDSERKATHERSRLKLVGIITQIEENIQHLDARYQELKADAQKIFDNPDFQKHGYDLHAVVFHDGLFGRSHLYSYTKDENGRWWKILDYQISEVSEDVVLNDTTGFHLGAGPLLLFYTQTPSVDPVLANTPEPRWPRIIRDLVRQDNYTFVAQLPTEISSSVASGPGAEARLFRDEDLEDFNVHQDISVDNETQGIHLET